VCPGRDVVLEEYKRPSKGFYCSRPNHMGPETVRDDRREFFSTEQPSQSLTGSKNSPWAACSYFAEEMYREILLQQTRTQRTFETKANVMFILPPTFNQFNKEALNAPKKIAAPQMQEPFHEIVSGLRPKAS
jgi:hypothetical protein